MTQHKNNVKMIVGQSLNAYHNKSKEQVDRLEEKYVEQNHKINTITGSLSNDNQLISTHESGIILLENSKDGLVYIDELEGHTMVNSCINGEEERILNGNIEAEGYIISTDEGVDNVAIEIGCEGNTLFNCIEQPVVVVDTFKANENFCC